MTMNHVDVRDAKRKTLVEPMSAMPGATVCVPLGFVLLLVTLGVTDSLAWGVGVFGFMFALAAVIGFFEHRASVKFYVNSYVWSADGWRRTGSRPATSDELAAFNAQARTGWPVAVREARESALASAILTTAAVLGVLGLLAVTGAVLASSRLWGFAVPLCAAAATLVVMFVVALAMVAYDENHRFEGDRPA